MARGCLPACLPASGAQLQLQEGARGPLPGALPGLRVRSVARAEPALAGISEQVASQLAEGKPWARGVPGGPPGQRLSRVRQPDPNMQPALQPFSPRSRSPPPQTTLSPPYSSSLAPLDSRGNQGPRTNVTDPSGDGSAGLGLAPRGAPCTPTQL